MSDLPAAERLLEEAEKAAKSNVPKVPCPKCGAWESAVKDGRASERGYRRKRECKGCGKTFFTIEQAA